MIGFEYYNPAKIVFEVKLADQIESGNIVVVFSDRGDRYLSKGLF